MINACGPCVDRLRQLDDAQARPILKASTGIHIILSQRFAPPEAGLMIPKIEDGRVLFILPWQGRTLIGDDRGRIGNRRPSAGQGRRNRIPAAPHQPLFQHGSDALRRQLGLVGLRPLVQAPDTANTAQLVREHLIDVADSGLLTVAGGKWTSYRRMAEEAVDQAIKTFLLGRTRACYTKRYPLFGAEHFDVHAEAG